MPLELLERPVTATASNAHAGPAERRADRPATESTESVMEMYLLSAKPADPSGLAKILDFFRA